jgi:hypothetical protein
MVWYGSLYRQWFIYFWSRVYITIYSYLSRYTIQMSYVIVENDVLDETSQIQSSFDGTTHEIIEIPPDCVEYMGKLMCGEIVFSDDGNPSSKVINPSPDNLRTPTLLGSSSVEKPSVVYTPLKNNVFHHIYETHIHICECIAIFSCCRHT